MLNLNSRYFLGDPNSGGTAYIFSFDLSITFANPTVALDSNWCALVLPPHRNS